MAYREREGAHMTADTATGIVTILTGLGLFTVFIGVAFLLYNVGQGVRRGG